VLHVEYEILKFKWSLGSWLQTGNEACKCKRDFRFVFHGLPGPNSHAAVRCSRFHATLTTSIYV